MDKIDYNEFLKLVQKDYILSVECILENAKSYEDIRKLILDEKSGKYGPFINAASRGHCEIAELLLKYSSEDDRNNQIEYDDGGCYQETSLMMAVNNNHPKMVELICSYLNEEQMLRQLRHENLRNNTALYYAFKINPFIAKFLIKYLPYKEQIDYIRKYSCLDQSVRSGNHRSVKLVLSYMNPLKRANEINSEMSHERFGIYLLVMISSLRTFKILSENVRLNIQDRTVEEKRTKDHLGNRKMEIVIISRERKKEFRS